MKLTEPELLLRDHSINVQLVSGSEVWEGDSALRRACSWMRQCVQKVPSCLDGNYRTMSKVARFVPIPKQTVQHIFKK